MVFVVGVKRNPTLVVYGEGVDKMSRDDLIDLANQYVSEQIYWEPVRVIRRKGYVIIVLAPQDYDF